MTPATREIVSHNQALSEVRFFEKDSVINTNHERLKFIRDTRESTSCFNRSPIVPDSLKVATIDHLKNQYTPAKHCQNLTKEEMYPAFFAGAAGLPSNRYNVTTVDDTAVRRQPRQHATRDTRCTPAKHCQNLTKEEMYPAFFADAAGLPSNRYNVTTFDDTTVRRQPRQHATRDTRRPCPSKADTAGSVADSRSLVKSTTHGPSTCRSSGRTHGSSSFTTKMRNDFQPSERTTTSKSKQK